MYELKNLYEYCAYTYVHHMTAWLVPMEIRRQYWVP